MPQRASQFLDAIRPVLADGDPEQLARVARDGWSPREVCGFLSHTDADVRHAAAFILGIIGHDAHAGPLMRSLHSRDATLVQLAENSLWSIWFRSGHPGAAETFSRGVAALADDRIDEAQAELQQATELDPHFAEAFNQLAICHFVRGDYDASLRCCERAVALMPTHFGAWAGKGHSHVHLGQVAAAVDCYRRALAIHPTLEAVRESLRQLETATPQR